MAHLHGHHHAHHHAHHHHRGLVIAFVVAVVVAGVGIGVMALATNDTDEPVHDDLASASGLVAAPSAGTGESVPLVSVDLRDFPRGATVDFRPKKADCATDLGDAHATGQGDRTAVEAKLFGEIRCSPFLSAGPWRSRNKISGPTSTSSCTATPAPCRRAASASNDSSAALAPASPTS